MTNDRFSVGLIMAAVVLCVVPATASAQTARSAASQEKTADSLFAAKVYDRAFVLYDSLTRRDTAESKYWYQLGMAAANLSRYAEGATAFARASQLRPNPFAAYNAAAMHARLSHTDSAFAWLTQAVRTGFSNGTLLQQDDDLASIRTDARFARILFAATHAPAPCETAPENRRFDFWIGEWNVTTQGGTTVGQSSIQRVIGGCALLENWTSNRGDTGKSLNAFNSAVNQWQQFYVGQGGAVIEYDMGVWDGKSMTFRTNPAPAKSGGQVIGRLSFTPLADGTVRQHGEQSSDGGKTWSTTYDFYYHRKGP